MPTDDPALNNVNSLPPEKRMGWQSIRSVAAGQRSKAVSRLTVGPVPPNRRFSVVGRVGEGDCRCRSTRSLTLSPHPRSFDAGTVRHVAHGSPLPNPPHAPAV